MLTTGSSLIDHKLRDTFRGQPESPNMVPFHMLDMVSNNNCSIVTLSVRLTIFEIFVFKNAVS